MASTLTSPPYTVPTLKYYFSPTTFHDGGSRSSSRPSSSSSSNSNYAPPDGSALPTHSSSYPLQSPASTSSPASVSSSPAQDSTYRMSRLHRPLPTPPTTPLSARSSLPPRPLPSPPLERAQSIPDLRAHPLPTPPVAPWRASAGGQPVASSSRAPLPTPPAAHDMPRAQRTLPPTERPSIRLSIPAAPHTPTTIPPRSPITIDMSGPRDVRRRREEELSRRMSELGFVESPRTPSFATPPSSSGPASHTHERGFSISSVESEEDRDVILLVDHDCDAEIELERPPSRSTSRQAMLTLFADDDDDEEEDGDTKLESIRELQDEADVKVEVVTKEAVARTKRRFSRKWIRERRGKRWTEQDFSEIIAQLRKLR